MKPPDYPFVELYFAKKLKEYNYDEKSLAYYLCDKLIVDFSSHHPNNKNSEFKSLEPNPWRRISAPLYQEVFDWLRDVHKIDITYNIKLIAEHGKFLKEYYYFSHRSQTDPLNWWKVKGFDNYYSALQNILDEVLNFYQAKFNL